MPLVSWTVAFLTFLVADCLWAVEASWALSSSAGGLTPAQFQKEGQGGEISTSDRVTSLD